LVGEELEEWGRYTRALRDLHVILSGRVDEMIWDHHPLGNYTLKNGYIQLNLEIQNRDLVWWWKQLWKLKCLAKAKLLFWMILENKTPTWDILQRRCFQGPGICALCRKDNESLEHIFIHCCYTQAAWAETCRLLNCRIGWQGPRVLEAFQNWWTEQTSELLGKS